jgi:hypothetical protein
MSITPKAIQDLLDELEASEQGPGSALGLPCGGSDWFFRDGQRGDSGTAQKAFDAKGEILQDALTKSFRIRNAAMKSLCSRFPAFGLDH